MGLGEDKQVPLLKSSSADISEEPIERTGSIWTALAHIITGVIGAGVLSLAWSIAHLGWIAGPLCMVAFAGVTIITSSLLVDCYRYPDPESGPIRISSYMQAVKFYLGDKSLKICGVFAHESLYGTGIAYTITTAKSISIIVGVQLCCPLACGIIFSYLTIKGAVAQRKKLNWFRSSKIIQGYWRREAAR